MRPATPREGGLHIVVVHKDSEKWISPGPIERLANRMDPCKDVGHGHLLQGHKDQGSGGGGSGHPKEGGRADLLRLPYHPQTLAEDEEGGQGPLARGFYGPKTAHPSHPRREEAPVGPARRERRRHARAPLRAVGREDGRQGVDLGHEPGHPREARLDLQKRRWRPPSETNKREVLSASA